MEELRAYTYDVGPNFAAPKVGQYLVRLNRYNKVTGVDLVKSVRVVKRRTIQAETRYALELLGRNSLIELAVVEGVQFTDEYGTHNTAAVWVQGVPALPSYSNYIHKKP